MSRNEAKHPKVSAVLIEALETVLAYLWSAEFQDYQCCEPAQRENHVFRKLADIRRWLNERS